MMKVPQTLTLNSNVLTLDIKMSKFSIKIVVSFFFVFLISVQSIKKKKKVLFGNFIQWTRGKFGVEFIKIFTQDINKTSMN